tara:strand:- start:175 stop:1029 length:855 start_codon:yes stop_codon:yes gene_type:complete
VIKENLDLFLKDKNIKGTILISQEGINCSISGSKIDLDTCINFIKKIIKIRKLEIKFNSSNCSPFKKLKVKLKKELVTLAKGNIFVKNQKGEMVEPENWDKLVKNSNTTLIDVRNKYEIEIGSFSNSINPKTNNFREFPSAFKKMNLSKDTQLAMFCTGGIRCEKASAYLKSQGYKNIYQLKGGILNYLDHKSKNKTPSYWNNECFVFDDRVAINSELHEGKYFQCYGCRRPITKAVKKSRLYKEGVYCPKCFYERTNKQKKRSESRQQQINLRKVQNNYNYKI